MNSIKGMFYTSAVEFQGQSDSLESVVKVVENGQSRVVLRLNMPPPNMITSISSALMPS